MTGLITIKETITLAQAEDLSALTAGVVTATVAPAMATELLAATFKGTDVLTVTVKGEYTAADLILLNAETQFDKISLSNKAQALTADVADVVTALADTGYKGNVTVTGATAITTADLIALNDLTTGKITLNAASLADTATYSATAANLVKAFDGITGLKGDVTISSGATTIAQLKAINKATTGAIAVTANQTLSGTAKDLVEALKDVTLSADSTVEVTGPVTLAQIIELQKSVDALADLTFANTSAALTGTTADILAALDSAPVDYKGAIKVTDAVNAADLKTINDATTGKITLTVLTPALNGTAADLAAALDGITGYKGNVRVSNAVDATELLTINKATSGVITLDDKDGTLEASAKDLIAALDGITGYTGDITIALTSSAATLAQLKAINALTSGDITLDALTAQTNFKGSAVDLLATFDSTILNYTGSLTVTGAYTTQNVLDLETSSFDYTLSNKAQALTADVDDVAALVTALADTGYKGNVTVTGATAIDIADLIALNDLTTGKITLNAASLADTATYSATAANLVKAFDGITGLKGDVTISSGATTIAQLKAINKATTGAIAVTANQTLSGTAKDLVEALKDVTLTVASTVEVTGPVTLAQILALQGTGADVEFANTSAALTGTHADILAALDSAPVDYKGAIKVTDAVNAADLKTINNATDGAITLTKVSEPLSGDYAAITAALDGITGYKGAIELTGPASDTAANINAVAKLTTGKLTETLDAGTDITDATVTALKDVNTNDSITFVATDPTADATAFLALSKLIPTATFAIVAEITEDASQIGTGAINVINALNKLNNGDTDVTLTGTVSVANVKAIDTATTGEIAVTTVKTAGGAFDLSDLDSLTEITDVTTIDAQDGKTTNITLSIADIFAANDTVGNFTFNIIGDSKDTVTISDVTGWNSTILEVVGDKQYTFNNGTDTITVNLTNVYDVVLPA